MKTDEDEHSFKAVREHPGGIIESEDDRFAYYCSWTSAPWASRPRLDHNIYLMKRRNIFKSAPLCLMEIQASSARMLMIVWMMSKFT